MIHVRLSNSILALMAQPGAPSSTIVHSLLGALDLRMVPRPAAVGFSRNMSVLCKFDLKKSEEM